MNRRIASTAVAAVALFGVTIVIVPQHGWSAARVLAVAVAVVTGALVLLAIGPFVRREAPSTALDQRAVAGAPPLDPHGLRDARRDLARPSAPGSVPPDVWDRLVVAATMRLHHVGIDVDTPRGLDQMAAVLDPDVVALLATEPRRGAGRDPDEVAAIVHRTLDELDGLVRPTGAAHGRR